MNTESEVVRREWKVCGSANDWMLLNSDSQSYLAGLPEDRRAEFEVRELVVKPKESGGKVVAWRWKNANGPWSSWKNDVPVEHQMTAIKKERLDIEYAYSRPAASVPDGLVKRLERIKNAINFTFVADGVDANSLALSQAIAILKTLKGEV